jgi:hypothetical protein
VDDELRTQTLDPTQTVTPEQCQQLSDKAQRLLSDFIDQQPTGFQNQMGPIYAAQQAAFEKWAQLNGTTYHNLSPGGTTPGTIGKGNWP